jgi:hypothetical protein
MTGVAHPLGIFHEFVSEIEAHECIVALRR